MLAFAPIAPAKSADATAALFAPKRAGRAGAPPLAIDGLPPDRFAPLFALDDAELFEQGIRRVVVPENPGIQFPCRVSLDYPRAGEEMLLLNYRHLDAPHSPYRAEGPIFVRRHVEAFHYRGEFPPIVLQRAMAVRGYDAAGMMLEADLAEKEALVRLIQDWLARPDIAHVDIHSARRGCFFCRIRRA